MVMGAKKYLFGAVLLLSSLTVCAQLPVLRVHGDGRYLMGEGGKPFIWIGDTNWFFARLPSATIDSLLDLRQQQGYTIMSVACRETLFDGSVGPGRPGRPNERWWQYLDEYIEKCEQRGLYVALALGWYGVAKQYDAEVLRAYGKWVGNRYRKRTNIVWLTLGEAGGHLRKDTLDGGRIRALAGGIREGDTGNKLLTVHADYQRGTSLGAETEWVDFNNWQTSQWTAPAELPRKDERNWTAWEAINYDYDRRYRGRPKPTLDLEAWYEGNKDFCGATPFSVRRRAYFTLLAGACGFTYGAGGVWDGLRHPVGCSSDALGGMQRPGGAQIGYLASLLKDMGGQLLALRPAQRLIAEPNSSDYDRHLQAAATQDLTLALVYTPTDEEFTLRLTGWPVGTRGRWYNPRTGKYGADVELTVGPAVCFDPPGASGPGNDWVLFLRSE